MDWMQQDTNGDMLKRCLLYNAGVQHFLNLCFEADGLVTKYTNLLSQVPNELNTDTIDDLTRSLLGKAATLRCRCIKANLDILDGTAAEKVLSIYSAFFDFCSSSWEGWTIPDQQQRFDICCDLIPVMQDVFFRLIHRAQVPKIQILSACSVDLDGDECNGLAAIGSIVDPLLEKAAACDECVDFAFTLPWAHRLSGHGPGGAKQAWLALGDIVSLLRVAATLVEKKHLVGQEAKPRKRGVCIAADECGGFVFHKLVEKAAEHCRDTAMRECLGEHRRQFSLCVDELLVEGHADRRSESHPDTAAAVGPVGRDKAVAKRRHNILALESKLKRQTVRGYDVFVRTNFTDELEGDSVFARRKLLDGKWKALSAVEKASYNAIAEAEDAEDADHENDTFVEFLVRSREAGKKRKSFRYRSSRLRAVRRSFEDIVGHNVFRAGTELHEFDRGLKPCLIQSQMSQPEINSAYKQLFDYDHVPVPNPPNIGKYFKPCCVRHGGYCKNSPLIDIADTLTSNLHAVSKEWKSQFPVLLQISSINDDVSQFAFLGKLFGRNMALFSECAFVPREHPDSHDCCDLMFQSATMHLPVTAHALFIDVITSAARASGIDPEHVDALTLRRWNYVREPSVDHFRAKLVEVHAQSDLPCSTRVKAANAAKDDDSLPFGLGRPEKSSKRKPAGPFQDPVPSDANTDHDHNVDAPSCNDAVASDEQVADDESAAADDVDDYEPSGGSDSDGGGVDILDAEPWNAAGLKVVEIAPPAARAACEFCKIKIKGGNVRFDYRFMVSNNLKDQKRICSSCVHRVPAETRARDILQCRRWLAVPDQQHAIMAVVESLLEQWA